jgi:hypothetical protein
MMARLGFSITHDEVSRYKQYVTLADHPCLSQVDAKSFTQWSGDNVDHNIKTIDGTGTFHGMGIISMSTRHGMEPGGSFSKFPVQRLKRQTVSKLVGKRGNRAGYPSHTMVYTIDVFLPRH